MQWQWFVLLGTLVVGGLSSYTTTVAGRGPGGREAVASQPAFRAIFGGLSIIACFAAVIWGGIYLSWLWSILAFVGVLLFNGVIYGQRFAFWYAIQPALDVLCVAGALTLWIAG